MKVTVFLRNSLLIAGALITTASAGFGQAVPPRDTPTKPATEKTRDGKKPLPKETPRPAPIAAPSSERADQTDEAPAPVEDINPYYENYLREYRLGPSDVITVEVFGQCPDYCILARTVPPNARISYPLIRDGILVAGKTVQEVAAEITKKLDEFIIDPKVTVTLDKAMATRYAVMGNVAAPGIRVLDRRISVYEAVLESGGVTKNGNKDKVYVISYAKDGRLARKMVNLSGMEAGKADMVYLDPGDQVFVSGKGFTLEKFLTLLGQAGAAYAVFGRPY